MKSGDARRTQKLKLAGEGALEEGLLEFGQRGELALVDGFEPAVLGGEGVEFLDDGFLLTQRRNQSLK